LNFSETGVPDKPLTTLHDFNHAVVSCQACPRLVAWREKVAREKVRRFQHEEYWGKPVPSFGPLAARLLVVGLAPAAHGANRTGRMFTGDRSGEWLYRALYRARFASQEQSVGRGDGLTLRDCRITAVAHCAPPANKLTREEIQACSRFFRDEIAMLKKLRVVVALGRLAFQVVDRTLRLPDAKGGEFHHGATYELRNGVLLIASYHPSQQNTFTGKLTEEMLDDIFRSVRRHLEA